jgi:hypothetical protein
VLSASDRTLRHILLHALKQHFVEQRSSFPLACWWLVVKVKIELLQALLLMRMLPA